MGALWAIEAGGIAYNQPSGSFISTRPAGESFGLTLDEWHREVYNAYQKIGVLPPDMTFEEFDALAAKEWGRP